ncbi:hypothetical protein [Asaia sp. HN010]|uniref:hypothetical protein n=1 Tax=Asaia sp. HN010 TaxID=3081233 RepID=UPI0030163978
MQGNLPDGVTIADIERSYGFISADMSDDIENLETARDHLQIAFAAMERVSNNSRSNKHDDVLAMIEDALLPHCRFYLRELGVIERRAA